MICHNYKTINNNLEFKNNAKDVENRIIKVCQMDLLKQLDIVV
jgi:hypothetical protein